MTALVLCNAVNACFNTSMNRPVRFKGRNSYLSNFYACRIRVWGREFHTVESACQWKKCVHNNDRDTSEKMAATRTGLQAKHLSKNIREKAHLRESWNTQRRSVMYALVAVKFRERYLRKRLLSTGERELIEWVRSKEGFWGALTSEYARGVTYATKRVHSNSPAGKKWV